MRVQRRSKATAEETSSSTSTLGGSCASTGCSESSRWANECSVPMAAPSSWASAVPAAVGLEARRPRPSPGGARRTRSRSSAPAFSVKVMAAIWRSSTVPEVTRATTRPTSAVVLPEPAPASTNSVASRSVLDPIAGGLVGWSEER